MVGNLEVMDDNTRIDGKLTRDDSGTIILNGGYYTERPDGRYLDPESGLKSIPGDYTIEGTTYFYHVTQSDVTPAEIAPDDAPTVSTEGVEIAADEEADKETARTIVDQFANMDNTSFLIGGTGIKAAIFDVAGKTDRTKVLQTQYPIVTTDEKGKETIKEGGNKTPLDALRELTPNESLTNERVTIFVQSYMKVELTKVTISSEESFKGAELEMDITPMYRLVATTTPNDIKLDDNAVQLGYSQELTVNKPTTVRLPLPEDFDALLFASPAYVRHYDREYWCKLESSGQNNFIAFTVDHFSRFVVSDRSTAVATINVEDHYTNLQAAFNALRDGDTITTLVSGTVTIDRELTFYVDGPSADAVTIQCALGYQMTKSGTYPILYTITRVPVTPPSIPGIGGGSSGGSSSVGGSVSNPSFSPEWDIQGEGTAEVFPARASGGERVSIFTSPAAGWRLASLSVTDSRGRDVRVSGAAFTQPGLPVTIHVVFERREETAPTMNFADVSTGDWFYHHVQYVVENGLMNGTNATSFAPNATSTRAMLWTILARMDDESIGGANWAEQARAWAMRAGVSDGTNPNGTVTREQLVTMLYRAAGEPEVSGTLSAFADANSVSTYARTAMAWAVQNGIVSGVGGNRIDPLGSATRAQLAAMLQRYAA